jgi:hypothetical protein
MAVTATYTPVKSKYSLVYEKISVAWTSDGSGNASGTVSAHGYVAKMVTDPTDSPTDNYDITMIDAYGADALEGAGVDRDTTNSEGAYPTKSGASIPVFLSGDHTFTIANAGATKSGVCVFYILESL